MKRAIAAAVAILAGLPAAWAADCGPLKIVAQVRLEPSPSGRQQFVPVEIAGVAKKLLLDTGSSFSAISERTATELGLKIKRTGYSVYTATGASTNLVVTAPVAIGALKGAGIDFFLWPDDFGDEFTGLIGADVLAQFDISADFGAHTLDIVSQDHCDGHVKYWKGQPLAIIPFTRAKSGHIIVPVEIDGQRVNAILDTGATNSTVNRIFAENWMGLKVGSPDTPAVGELNGEAGSTIWHHKFHTLTFEGVTVANPEFTIIPERIRKHFDDKELGSLISRPDVPLEPDALLGMDVLRHLHVYIAYKEKKLYITPSAAELPPP